MIQEISFLPRTLSRGSSRKLVKALTGVVVICMFLQASNQANAQAQASMLVDFVDEKTGEPLPVRIELRDSKGRPQKVKGAVNRAPWSLLEGQLQFKSRLGSYRFDVFHGPQYAAGSGGFTLAKDGEGTDVVRLPRHATIESEGWFGGDLLSFVPAEETGKWLPAEDLQMAVTFSSPSRTPALTKDVDNESPEPSEAPANPESNQSKVAIGIQRFKADRWVHHGGYIDDRAGGNLVIHGWQPPAEVPSWVPPSQLVSMAKKDPQVHIELSRVGNSDTPLLLATEQIDAIQLLSEHTTRDGKSEIALKQMYNPDPRLFQGPRGGGKLVEHLYWQMLEAGLRIPPSAGSGFGRTSSPLGYNRVYVLGAPNQPDEKLWWQALKTGKSFVTNGPLLRPTVNGEPPGHIFSLDTDEKMSLTVGLVLTVSDPVEYVDVIFNGDALYHARLDEHAKRGGKIPPLEITESGWLVVRVVAQREETYRMASSAPYYFEVDGKRRISRNAVKLFQDWLESSSEELSKSEPQRAKASQPYLESARKYWSELANQANTP